MVRTPRRHVVPAPGDGTRIHEVQWQSLCRHMSHPFRSGRACEGRWTHIKSAVGYLGRCAWVCTKILPGERACATVGAMDYSQRGCSLLRLAFGSDSRLS